jgi:hypothetical protein
MPYVLTPAADRLLLATLPCHAGATTGTAGTRALTLPGIASLESSVSGSSGTYHIGSLEAPLETSRCLGCVLGCAGGV